MFPKLKQGATIGIIAPSSPAAEKEIERGVQKLESMGFKVVLGKSVGQSYFSYLSGCDELRAKDFNEMFQREDIDAIICQSGGYGSPRMIDLIDFEMIKKHPKVFSGYSDVTSLLNALYSKSGLVTFHGPMLCGDFNNDHKLEHIDSFIKLATTNEELVIIDDKMIEITKGSCEGILVGGNLSLIDAMIGTDFSIHSDDKILLIEDVHEELYRLDRMMQKLRLSGMLKHLKGVIVGGLTKEKTPQDGALELFKEIFKQYTYPVIFNAPIGHVTQNYTVPIGGVVSFDTTVKTIIVKRRKSDEK